MMLYKFHSSPSCGWTHVNTDQIVRVSQSARKEPVDGFVLHLRPSGFTAEPDRIDGVSSLDMHDLESLSRLFAEAAVAYLDANSPRS